MLRTVSSISTNAGVIQVTPNLFKQYGQIHNCPRTTSTIEAPHRQNRSPQITREGVEDQARAPTSVSTHAQNEAYPDISSRRKKATSSKDIATKRKRDALSTEEPPPKKRKTKEPRETTVAPATKEPAEWSKTAREPNDSKASGSRADGGLKLSQKSQHFTDRGEKVCTTNLDEMHTLVSPDWKGKRWIIEEYDGADGWKTEVWKDPRAKVTTKTRSRNGWTREEYDRDNGRKTKISYGPSEGTDE